MLLLLNALALEQITLFSLILIVTFIGGYVRDFITSFEKTENKMRMYFGKILVSALAMAILMFLFGEALVAAVGVRIFLGICFIAGMASYSIIPLFFTIEGLTKIVTLISAIRKAVGTAIGDSIKGDDNNGK